MAFGFIDGIYGLVCNNGTVLDKGIDSLLDISIHTSIDITIL